MPLPSFRSQFRRAAALALTASAMFGTQIAAFAQDGPPDEGDDTIEIVGWDLSDPVNRAESREFFAGLWAAQDAGLPPPEFEFTNLPPDLLLAMLLPELEVFTEIYRHRLQLDFDAGERYLVTDLIAEDAEVRSEFRAFVLTGKLAPRPEIDAEAYLAHFELVIDAMTVQQRASIERVEALGVLVESEGMSVEREPEPPFLEDAPILVSPNQVRCALYIAATASRLSCLAGLRLYAQGEGHRFPDFDCDDFSEALYWFLRRHLNSSLEPEILYLGWKCGNTVSGHVIVVVRDAMGRWYWIEPQTGRSGGPFESAESARNGWVSAHPIGTDCVLRDFTWRYHPDPMGVHPNVPWRHGPSWFTDRAQVARFCERYAECCAQPLPAFECDPGPYLPDLDTLRGCNVRWFMPPSWPERPGGVPGPEWTPPAWPGPGLPCGYPASP